MNEYSENWKSHKEHLKKVKARNREKGIEPISNGYEENFFDHLKTEYSIRRLTPYQFRITKGDHSIDIYPKNCKYHDLKTGERGEYSIVDGEKEFLATRFK